MGPWFTVQEHGAWKDLGTFFLSNGTSNTSARLELKLELTEGQEKTPHHPANLRKATS